MPGKVIFNATVFADHLVWLEREACRPRLVAKPEGGEPFAVEFDAPVLHLRLERNFDFFEPIVRVTFSTPIDPDETYDIDLRSREREAGQEEAHPERARPLPLRDAARLGDGAGRRKNSARPGLAQGPAGKTRACCCSTAMAPMAWRCRTASTKTF